MKINKIDTERYYNTHLEILKECFNIELKTHRSSICKLTDNEAIWFPKQADKVWENNIVDDTIREYVKDDRARSRSLIDRVYTRYTFIGTEDGYKWQGIYVFDDTRSNEKYNVYRKIL
jgi:hypothetical protein